VPTGQRLHSLPPNPGAQRHSSSLSAPFGVVKPAVACAYSDCLRGSKPKPPGGRLQGKHGESPPGLYQPASSRGSRKAVRKMLIVPSLPPQSSLIMLLLPSSSDVDGRIAHTDCMHTHTHPSQVLCEACALMASLVTHYGRGDSCLPATEALSNIIK
jgi:hypothetical protein